MNRLEVLLDEVAAALAHETTDPVAGARAVVVELAVDLPLESRIVDRELWASVPRSRLSTGFDPPRGRVQARFVREEP